MIFRRTRTVCRWIVALARCGLDPDRTKAAVRVAEFRAEIGSARADAAASLGDFVAGRRILQMAPEEQIFVIFAIADKKWKLRDASNKGRRRIVYALLDKLQSELLRRKLPYSKTNVIDLFKRSLIQLDDRCLPGPVPLWGAIRAAELRKGVDYEISPRIGSAIKRARKSLSKLPSRYKDEHAFEPKLAGLVEDFRLEKESEKNWLLYWLDDKLRPEEQERRALWEALFREFLLRPRGEPSRRWWTRTEARIDAIGQEAFAAQFCAWCYQGMLSELVPTIYNEHEVERQLVWCSTLVPTDDVVRAVGHVAYECFRDRRGGDSPSGNFCLRILGRIGTWEAAGQLQRVRLNSKLRTKKGRDYLNEALAAVADRLGVEERELEEFGVATFDLDANGSWREPVGDFHAEVRVVGGRTVELGWVAASGKIQSSVPAQVKKDFAGELKIIRRRVKDMRAYLSSQRIRMERLFMADRSWDFATWQKLYLDHPLLAGIVRGLIWRFADGEHDALAIPGEAGICDVEDRPLAWLANETQVRLWHPIDSTTEEVLAWREWLHRHEVRQPFKQAYREIYVLTDAERETGTYSNRFAGHILRQPQFVSVARSRGWDCELQGDYKSDTGAGLSLPLKDTFAEYLVDGIRDDDLLTEMGVCLFAATERVRFYTGNFRPVALEELPARAFSETMRDADLFVSVCSIGNDALWIERGEATPFNEYWREYAFGGLTATADTRKDALNAILPKLEIADRCKVDGRYLVVRGDLGTYRIHLGSGGVKMEPDDTYLCIVPGGKHRSATYQRFLPFDDDTILPVILSKAFLLADDSRIKDETILSQMRR